MAAEIERRRQALVEADREVRVLEKLRQRQAEQHRREEELREAKRLDEVAAQQAFRQDATGRPGGSAMIGKLLGMLVSLVAAVCVATVIAAVVLIAFYAQSWKVDRERFVQAMAILQGKSPESLLPPPPPKKENDSEQPAYEQFLAAQGLKARDLEQREMTVRANIRQFQEELDKIVEEKKRVQSVRDDLQAKLDELEHERLGRGHAKTSCRPCRRSSPSRPRNCSRRDWKKATSTSWSSCLSGMSDGKRAKIIAEFKTATEMEQIGEVLNRIRQGQPTAEHGRRHRKETSTAQGAGTVTCRQ